MNNKLIKYIKQFLKFWGDINISFNEKVDWGEMYLEMVINRTNFYKALRFRPVISPVLDGDSVYEAVIIALADNDSGKILEVTEYSNLLLGEGLLNRDKNTRLAYAKFICLFLNYIFFDKQNIESDKKSCKFEIKNGNFNTIENLKIDDGKRFINAYKIGLVGANYTKTKDTIQIAEHKLTNFYYFLFKNFKMKHLSSKDFVFVEYEYTVNGKRKKGRRLKSLFHIVYPNNVIGRQRLEYISFYALIEFISLAYENYPMIALAIALQAFAGLRKGEVMNSCFYNVSYTYMGTVLKNFSIDLRIKPQLRSDGVDVGEIKSPLIAHVHPAFIELFEIIFNEHENYLNNVIKKKNKYGAMFMNRFAEAMIDDSYERYFNKLVSMLIKKLQSSGIPTAISEAKRMMSYNFSTHTLRYFFSNYIGMLPDTNILELAMFRRDRNFGSVLTYIRNNPYLIDDMIKKIQNDSMNKRK